MTIRQTAEDKAYLAQFEKGAVVIERGHIHDEGVRYDYEHRYTVEDLKRHGVGCTLHIKDISGTKPVEVLTWRGDKQW